MLPSHEVPVEYGGDAATAELFKGACWWQPDRDAAIRAIRAAIEGRDSDRSSPRDRIVNEFTWERATTCFFRFWRNFIFCGTSYGSLQRFSGVRAVQQGTRTPNQRLRLMWIGHEFETAGGKLLGRITDQQVFTGLRGKAFRAQSGADHGPAVAERFEYFDACAAAGAKRNDDSMRAFVAGVDDRHRPGEDGAGLSCGGSHCLRCARTDDLNFHGTRRLCSN